MESKGKGVMASVVQRRKFNKIEQLEKKKGGCYINKGEMVEEISDFYDELFISEDSIG